jgi:adenylylsulfate kinase-like enzyme
MIDRGSMLRYQKELKEFYQGLIERDDQIYRMPVLENLDKKGNLVVCTGYSGSGKTTLGSRMEDYGFKVINNDEIRKELYGPGLVDAEKEAKVLKASVELMDFTLFHGYDTIITNCSPTNFYRKSYLSTEVPVASKTLVHFLSDKETIERRKGKGAYEFIDSLWEKPELKAPYMKGVKYIRIDSSKDENLDKNVKLVLNALGISA